MTRWYLPDGTPCTYEVIEPDAREKAVELYRDAIAEAESLDWPRGWSVRITPAPTSVVLELVLLRDGQPVLQGYAETLDHVRINFSGYLQWIRNPPPPPKRAGWLRWAFEWPPKKPD